MLPLDCLPLWGSEGVTILAVAEYKQITGKRGFQQSLFPCIFPTPSARFRFFFKPAGQHQNRRHDDNCTDKGKKHRDDRHETEVADDTKG